MIVDTALNICQTLPIGGGQSMSSAPLSIICRLEDRPARMRSRPLPAHHRVTRMMRTTSGPTMHRASANVSLIWPSINIRLIHFLWSTLLST